jgi:hypothetical protein
MNDTNTKVKEVTFDLVSCLTLIGSDEPLLLMYKNKFGVDINLAITNAKQGVKSESDSFVKGMFENIILTKRYVNQYIEIYTKLSPTPIEEEIPVPRRYGKSKIIADITEQGGKPNDTQRMMLKVNDLKNIVARLQRMGKAKILGKDMLTDEQCREIIGTIEIVENKLKRIIK